MTKQFFTARQRLKLVTASTLLATLLLSGTRLGNAHHSFAAEFQADNIATFHGVVTEVWFRNPHVRYYIEITNENGDTEIWDSRGSSPTLLVRRGWTPDTIKEGDQITVTGHLGHDDRKLLNIISIKLADGTVLGEEY